MPEVIKLQVGVGIRKFKCATVAEAEMIAESGAAHVLVAYPVVGPNVDRCLELGARYPETTLAVVADSVDAVAVLGRSAASRGTVVEVWIDLDCGMGRTGVPPGDRATQVYRAICSTPGVRVGGVHAYDGHVNDPDLSVRRERCQAAFAPVWAWLAQVKSAGLPVPSIVAGGSPTFPFHAPDQRVECSPGTTVFWDAGYSTKYPDLPFVPAVVLLARVISRPTPNRACLDLGYKAVASEMPHPRVLFPGIPDAKPIMHSEEHLLLESDAVAGLRVGEVVIGVPWHVCPTVALYNEAWVVSEGRLDGTWQIRARGRRITV